MIVAVDFWSRDRAKAHPFTNAQAVISITDPDQPLVVFQGVPCRVARSRFLDLEEPVDHPKCPPDAVFSTNHATRLVRAIRAWHAEGARMQVIVHCTAGVSRSAGVALYIEAQTGCAFKRRAQTAFANRRVITLLEEVSGCAIFVPDAESESGTGLL